MLTLPEDGSEALREHLCWARDEAKSLGLDVLQHLLDMAILCIALETAEEAREGLRHTGRIEYLD